MRVDSVTEPSTSATRSIGAGRDAVNSLGTLQPEWHRNSRLPASTTPAKLCKSDLGRDDLSGLEISHYRLGRRLGGGGMGVVYRANHLHLGKAFAIKFISSEALRSAEATQRFVQEFTAVGQLNHPHVVSATDAGSIDGISYFVTELLEGGDLAQRLAAKQPPRFEAACEIVRQSALGLAHAHECGFLHRDIKPSNLFLENHGNVRLIDFGLVRSRHATSELTCAGQMMGTVDYFSPEQSEDSRTCTPASDIYGLGAAFVFLLSGQPPYPDSAFPSMVSKLRGHMVETAPWLATVASSLPPPLRRLIVAMMAKSPAARPLSCAIIADALTQWADRSALEAWLKLEAEIPIRSNTLQSSPPAAPKQRGDVRSHAAQRLMDFAAPRFRIPALALGTAVTLTLVAAPWGAGDPTAPGSLKSYTGITATDEAAVEPQAAALAPGATEPALPPAATGIAVRKAHAAAVVQVDTSRRSLVAGQNVLPAIKHRKSE